MSLRDIDDQIKHLKCEYAQQHGNQEIIQVDVENETGIEKKNRLLCKYCLQTPPGKNRMGIENVIRVIIEKYKNIEQYRQEKINQEQQQLIEIKSSLQNLQSSIFQILNETNNLIDQLNNELSHLNYKIQVNLVEEIEEVAEQYRVNSMFNDYKSNQNNLIFEEFHKKFSDIKISYQEKFKTKVQNVQVSISNMIEQITKYNNRDEKKEKELIENNISRISRIKIIRDQAVQCSNISEIDCNCIALAFDYECKCLAVATYKKNVVDIYNIENKKLEDIKSTLNHEAQVYSIIYSKNQNWLATGIATGEVLIWKFQNFEWKKYIGLNAHQRTVFCLLLNQKEDLLFSCSEDESIIIWDLNIAQNTIQKQKEIKVNQGSIFSLTLNKSEDKLACCSRQNCIIIWEYSKNQDQWYRKQDIMSQEFGHGFRIGFYNNTYLIFQPSNNGICIVYEEKDNIFQQFQKLQLNQIDTQDNIGLSPIQYNQTKNIMILKQNQYVYFIRQLSDKNFQIIGDYIKYPNNGHFSAISQNGEYLASCQSSSSDDKQSAKLILYKLDYE
ncbi:unnamed protein product [Paramecium octaurelia]|uniref:WD40-repeat-containing domain n=1 Tax=Paramecium octaurelia TaxID=43137 RepID=A0A8S1UII3_PAROT|nr:unnamed protein product [Paramecium octaurelia]